MNSITPLRLTGDAAIEPMEVAVQETRFVPEQIQSVVARWWQLQDNPGMPPRIEQLADLRRHVPTMTGSDYAALGRQAFARRGDMPVYVGGSSGTTGKSKLVLSRILLPGERPSAHDIALITDLRKSGLAGPNDVFANMFVVASFSILHHGMNKILEACQASIVPVGALQHGGLEAQVDFLAACGVNALAGTPGSLLQLAHALRATGRSLPIHRILYTGESFGPAKRALVQNVFPQARITGLFGLSEVGFVGFETATAGVYRVREDAYFLETASDGTLLVTSLDPHQTVPILRYAAGDSASLSVYGNTTLLRGIDRIGLDFNFMGNLVEFASVRTVTRQAIGIADADIQITLSSDEHGHDLLTVGVFGEALDADLLDEARGQLLRLPELREAIDKQAGDVLVRCLPPGPPMLTVRQKQQVIIDRRT